MMKIYRFKDSSRQSMLTVFMCCCTALLQHASVNLQGAIIRLTGCQTKIIMQSPYIILHYLCIQLNSQLSSITQIYKAKVLN